MAGKELRQPGRCLFHEYRKRVVHLLMAVTRPCGTTDGLGPIGPYCSAYSAASFQLCDCIRGWLFPAVRLSENNHSRNRSMSETRGDQKRPAGPHSLSDPRLQLAAISGLYHISPLAGSILAVAKARHAATRRWGKICAS